MVFLTISAYGGALPTLSNSQLANLTVGGTPSNLHVLITKIIWLAPVRTAGSFCFWLFFFFFYSRTQQILAREMANFHLTDYFGKNWRNPKRSAPYLSFIPEFSHLFKLGTPVAWLALCLIAIPVSGSCKGIDGCNQIFNDMQNSRVEEGRYSWVHAYWFIY